MGFSISVRDQCLYLTDAKATHANVEVDSTDVDEGGAYAIFNKTIFHPKGGGQLNDVGAFSCEGKFYSVTNLAFQENVVKHYFNSEEGSIPSPGAVATLKVDENTRNLHARLHSAGHLLECATGTLFPQLEAYKGSHAPNGQASINFKNEKKISLPDKEQLEILANQLVSQGIPVNVSWDESNNTRFVYFEGYPPIPCGGTHLENSAEIGSIEVRYVKKDKTDVKIGYDVK